jgi:hypothetical protein
VAVTGLGDVHPQGVSLDDAVLDAVDAGQFAFHGVVRSETVWLRSSLVPYLPVS